MEKMKNMIAIKNIKSNLVEEAIIVFKENVKIKQKQALLESAREKEEQAFDKDYYIKEAQGIILDYIKEIEEKRNNKKIKIQLKFLKIVNISLVLILLGIVVFLF